MEDTAGREFFKRQLAYIQAMDLEGLAANQYTEDAEMVGFDFTAKGRPAIVDHFVNYMKVLGQIELNSVEKWAETPDTVFFEATMTTNLGVAKVYDAFVLRDGKATHHFTGVISVSPAPNS